VLVAELVSVGDVEVDLTSLLREWRRQQSHEFWMQLRTAESAAGAFDEALDEVNARHDPDGVIAQIPTAAPKASSRC
jgi:hypothetical protein